MESIPFGWALVPVNPTIDMLFAGDTALYRASHGELDPAPEEMKAAYLAMLASAPTPATGAEASADAHTGDGDPVWLDDEGRAMIVNSHHYTVENIAALIAELKRLEDPRQSTQADLDNKDLRTLCGVLWRVISALASDVPLATQAAADAPEAAWQKAMLDKVDLISLQPPEGATPGQILDQIIAWHTQYERDFNPAFAAAPSVDPEKQK